MNDWILYLWLTSFRQEYLLNILSNRNITLLMIEWIANALTVVLSWSPGSSSNYFPLVIKSLWSGVDKVANWSIILSTAMFSTMSLSEESIIHDENKLSIIVVHKRFLMRRTLLIALSALLLVIASEATDKYLVCDIQCGKSWVPATLSIVTAHGSRVHTSSFYKMHICVRAEWMKNVTCRN